MEKFIRVQPPLDSRRWGAISLLETVAAYRKFHDPPNHERIPKRVKTDFFPSRHQGRNRYKENSSFILSPESYLKVFIDIVKVLTIMLESIIIPYMLCFSPDDINSLQNLIQLTEIFFTIDIFLNFNTEIYINGVHYSSRSVIAKYYLKTWFFFDILSTFPFALFIPQVWIPKGYLYITISGSEALPILWLFKLIRIFKIKDLIYSLEDYFVSSIFLSVIRAFKFVFSVYIWTHWLACLNYITFARAVESNPGLWSQYSYVDLDNYLRRIYLIIQTMTSVGYGDILPETANQYIVAIFSMSFAGVLFGNIIGNIQGYIDSYNADSKYFEQLARRLKNHLTKHKLPAHVKNRVVKYVYFIQQINKKNDPKDLDLLETLSPPLREEIFSFTRGYLLAQSVIFNCYSGAFLKYLGHQMKTEIFAAGDSIFKEGQIGSCLYYLCNGKVQIYHDKTKTIFKDIKKSKYFGEISFFLNKPRTASAMCIEFAEFLTLERSSLLEVLQSRPRELEITNVILYNTEKYKSLSLLGIRCYLCGVLGHVARDCQEFIFMINKQDIVSKAEAKKYVTKLNLNELPKSEFVRNKPEPDLFSRYKQINTKGFKFTPGTMYIENKNIIKKAWGIHYKKTIPIKRLIPKVNSFESDENSSNPQLSDRSPPSENVVTFGN